MQISTQEHNLLCALALQTHIHHIPLSWLNNYIHLNKNMNSRMLGATAFLY